MNYTPLTYPCPKCGSRRVAQDSVCAEREKPIMLQFCCCDCGHKFERLYVQPTGWLHDAIRDAAAKYADKYRKIIRDGFLDQPKDKEETEMKVTYNGMTGDLMELIRNPIRGMTLDGRVVGGITYDLTIYDHEKKATVHFENVNLADVKFSGGEVSFNG